MNAALPVLGRAALFLAAAGFIWLSIAVGVANIAGGVAPAVALRWWPYDARAKAELANLSLRPNSKIEDVQRAEGLAREAIARDPTSVAAVRALGLTASFRGQQARAARLFRYSARLSWRDLPTRLWFIEAAIARDDLTATLNHYDIGLRTSTVAQEVLLPTMVRATGDIRIIGPLALLLAKNPPWRPNFFSSAITAAPKPENVITLVEQLRSLRSSVDDETLAAFIERLVSQNKLGLAARVYRQIQPGAASGGINAGDFERDGKAPPFDWVYANSPGLFSERVQRDRGSGDHVLYYEARPNEGGELARQLLSLPQGRYRLNGISGANQGNTGNTPNLPLWRITCAVGTQQIAGEGAVSSAGDEGRRFTGRFTVPAGCQLQWLTLVLRADNQADVSSGWIDRISVQRD